MDLFTIEFHKRLVKKACCFLSVCSLFTFSSCMQNEAGIRGSLTGVESDTLLVFMDYMGSCQHFRTDTVALENYSFELVLPDTALYLNIIPKPSSPQGAIRMTAGRPIFFFPGDRLKVEGEWDHKKVSGSELYDELIKHESIQKMGAEIDELNALFTEAYRAKDENRKNDIRRRVRAKYGELQQAKLAFVKQKPSTLAAAYYATAMEPEYGLEAIGLLSEQVKNGPMKPVIDKSKLNYEERQAKEKAKKNVVPGSKAPDFSLKALDGKTVSLSTFKGKYLVLDFWGSWCGWCIKGFPQMKQYYTRYSNQVEILGVCCNDTEQKWKESVATHQLPWVNTFEGDTKISVKYAVKGFPTKILIDPDGEIVEVFVGESDSFYQKLDQLFKK